MNLKFNKLMIFGPITLLVEWSGILIGLQYLNNYNPNKAISTLTAGPNPLPIVFGATLTTVGITYFLFSLSLKHFSARIPVVAFIAGVAFTLTGWITYTGSGGWGDILHNLCNYIAIGGYIAMIWMMREHPIKPLRSASTFFFNAVVLITLCAFISLFILHKYIAYVQLTLLAFIQVWTLVVVWHYAQNRS